MYNLGDFYNFDYSYLFDNSTDYDSLIPTWDYRIVFKTDSGLFDLMLVL